MGGPELQAHQTTNSALLVLEDGSLPLPSSTIVYSTSIGTPRVFVPEPLRINVFQFDGPRHLRPKTSRRRESLFAWQRVSHAFDNLAGSPPIMAANCNRHSLWNLLALLALAIFIQRNIGKRNGGTILSATRSSAHSSRKQNSFDGPPPVGSSWDPVRPERGFTPQIVRVRVRHYLTSAWRLSHQHSCARDDIPSYLVLLRHLFQAIHPTGPRQVTRCHVFVGNDRALSPHLSLRWEVIRPPGSAPYDSPFEVLEWKNKTITIRVNGRAEVVPADRLKPACSASARHYPASVGTAVGDTQPCIMTSRTKHPSSPTKNGSFTQNRCRKSRGGTVAVPGVATSAPPALVGGDS